METLEEKRIETIQQRMLDERKKYKNQIEKLENKLTSSKVYLSFYFFEHLVSRNNLPKKIRDVFDINNPDAKRLEKIMSFVETITKETTFDDLPVEIKMIYKELI